MGALWNPANLNLSRAPELGGRRAYCVVSWPMEDKLTGIARLQTPFIIPKRYKNNITNSLGNKGNDAGVGGRVGGWMDGWMDRVGCKVHMYRCIRIEIKIIK